MLLAATMIVASVGVTLPSFAEEAWKEEAGGYRYVLDDGSYVTAQWKKVDGVWYYFNEKGYRQTGWKKIGNKWYYFSLDGRSQYGWQTIEGKRYYFDPNGVMLTGEVEIDGMIYTFGSDGVLTGDGKKGVGSNISFGNYEQDNNLANGKEAIQWRVVAVEEDRMLLVSLVGLDVQKYNQKWRKLTWENSTIRKWLNEVFIKEAFTSEEQAKILSTQLSDKNNAQYGTSWGEATTDKVFLLSRSEAEKYFPTNEGRKCWPTEYAKARGAYMSSATSTYGVGWWFLRSPGGNAAHAAGVTTTGKVDVFGNHVNFDAALIRPAVWVKVEK